MKKCPSCKEVKPIDEFGVDNGRKDGHNPYCKECARVKSRESNRKAIQKPGVRDKINAHNRERRKSPEYRAYAKALKQKPEYKAKAKALKQTEEYREKNRAYSARKKQDPEYKFRQREYVKQEYVKQRARLNRQRNKEHVNARTAVYRAIKKGILPHPTALKCEWENCQGQAKHYHHHKGYDKENRLTVQALCFTHHGYVSRK